MSLRVLWPGLLDYTVACTAMQRFTETRAIDTGDEVWIVEHKPVYTLGLSGRAEHILHAGAVPIVYSDRGGQVTYHGPGQAIAYLLLDLKRHGLGVKDLIYRCEQSVIDLLAEYQLIGQRRPKAPGVYTADAKIAALGFRIRRGCAYHGIALNVNMDLSPYARINPCGYPGLKVTQMRDLGVEDPVAAVVERWLPHLLINLGFDARRAAVALPRAATA